MNTSLTIQSMPTTICVQPDCLLRRVNLNVEYLAKILVGTLEGNSMDPLVPLSERINSRPHCTDCALRVLRGKRAFLTQPEWDHLNDLGQWHHRRSRKSDR